MSAKEGVGDGRGPQLVALRVSDRREAWASAGFVTDPVRIGSIEITFDPDPGDEAVVGGRQGITGWTFLAPAGAGPRPTDIDGIATEWSETDAITADSSPDDPPGAGMDTTLLEQSSLDHVVMFTSNLDRSITALESAGFPARRQRDVPGSTPARRQVFFWAGDAIIELVGPVEADPEDESPASLWGLAITSPDIDALATEMGERLGRVKTAVQAGRRISTIRTRDLGISVAIAVMTPHPG